MEKAFIDYLENIGISGALLTKVEDVYKFFNEYLEHKIDDIFVSEYVDQDGSRIYENLWFFNENFCFEAKLFNIQEDYDSCVIKNNIEYFTIKKIDCDLIANKTNDNSRMILDFRFKVSSIGGQLKSSKENCKYLSIIIKKYMKENQLARE